MSAGVDAGAVRTPEALRLVQGSVNRDLPVLKLIKPDTISGCLHS